MTVLEINKFGGVTLFLVVHIVVNLFNGTFGETAANPGEEEVFQCLACGIPEIDPLQEGHKFSAVRLLD